jgi:histidinol-phosphatase
VETKIKSDGSPVSEADWEVDRLLVAELSRERPDDSVLSEESGAHGVGPRRWILDPIDGTANFVTGKPSWGTHVALEQDGELVLGVITRPVIDQTWWATRGGGAYRTDASAPEGHVRLQVSARADLASSRVSIWSQRPSERAERLRAGSVLVEASLNNIFELAEGKLEAIVDAIGGAWDHAPGVILVEEAGGRYCDIQGGRRLDLGSGRYTNGCIDQALDRLLAP